MYISICDTRAVYNTRKEHNDYHNTVGHDSSLAIQRSAMPSKDDVAVTLGCLL